MRKKLSARSTAGDAPHPHQNLHQADPTPAVPPLFQFETALGDKIGSMVEVHIGTPVAYYMEPVIVEGKFQLVLVDEYGLFYRVNGAADVK